MQNIVGVKPIEWVTDWFAAKAQGIPLESNDNYFDKEVIDSFDVIILIEEIETQFDIKFTEQDFQDRRFVTMAGLAEIIMEIQKR